MDEVEFIKILKEEAMLLDVNMTDDEAKKFYEYMKLLIEWNNKMNLTAIIEPKEIIKKHFIDSITIMPYIDKNSRVIDVGTGAGFPGVPIKILNKDIELTLLDSLNKRLVFLEEVVQKLELHNVIIHHDRAEDAGAKIDFREQFDIAVSRAVASLDVLVEYLLPFVKVGGRVICMKASNLQEELKQAENAIEVLGGKVEKKIDLVLPKSDIGRTIIVIRKIKNTPNKYPRKAGIPAKQPL